MGNLLNQIFNGFTNALQTLFGGPADSSSMGSSASSGMRSSYTGSFVGMQPLGTVAPPGQTKQTTPTPQDQTGDQVARVTAPSRPQRTTTVGARVPWRTSADDLTTPVAGAPAQPDRRGWQPIRRDVGKSMLELNKMKYVSQNALGHGVRINEDLTMQVPIRVLPNELKHRR